MNKYKMMLGMFVKQEGAVAATLKMKMYPGINDSGYVPLLMIIPIVQITELVAKMDENRATYFSLN